MESLNSFLNPKRKGNLKFILSDAFVDESNKPIEWEMKQLSSKEGFEIQKQIEDESYSEIMAIYVAASLVYPNLHDAQLLNELSKMVGKPVLKAVDALKEITTDAELAGLIDKYISFNNLTTSFAKKVEEAKN